MDTCFYLLGRKSYLFDYYSRQWVDTDIVTVSGAIDIAISRAFDCRPSRGKSQNAPVIHIKSSKVSVGLQCVRGTLLWQRT